jgi:hypothetical protein
VFGEILPGASSVPVEEMMLETTQTARNVDCPFAALDALASLACKEILSDFSLHCKGDACMCWRWTDVQVGQGKFEGEYRGYCGLAGKPMEVEE